MLNAILDATIIFLLIVIGVTLWWLIDRVDNQYDESDDD